jgi:transcriptional regulator with XRE-family HTH domain
MTTANQNEQVWKSLGDPEYRHQFIDEGISVGIAFQIRALRNRQKLTQGELAAKLTSKQPAVSSWENPNYGNYTLKTLKDLAKAFDVGLLVRFVPFSELVDRTLSLTGDAIAPPKFAEEQPDRIQPGVINLTTETEATSKDIVSYLRHPLASGPSTAIFGPYDAIRAEQGVVV